MVKMVNRAKMSTPTTGTGTLTLGSAITGYQTFAASGVANADVVRYTLEDGAAWEIGLGTYTASGTLLSRTLEESSTGSLLNLSGNAEIFVTAAAADVTSDTANTASTLVARDASGNFSAGTATMDGLTVDGATTLNSASTSPLKIQRNSGTSSNVSIEFDGATQDFFAGIGAASEDFVVGTNANLNIDNRLRIAASGDISFYDNAGTTPKFFWDASAERLGVGTTNPQADLVISENGVQGLEILAWEGGDTVRLMGFNRSTSLRVPVTIDASQVIFQANTTTERMRIDSSGNVGIGESNPQELLHLTDTTPVFRMEGASRAYQQYVSGTSFFIRDVTAGLNRVTLDSSGDISFYEDTGTTPKFVWDASGEILGIGGSPNAALPATGTILQLQRTGGSSRLNITAANVSYSAIDFGDTDDLDVGKIEYYHANNTMYFSTNAANRMTINSNGIDVTGEVEADTAHFGTGTGAGASVADEVVVSGTGSTGLTIHSPDANNATLAFGSVTDNDYAFVQGFYNSGSPFLRFSIQSSEKVKVTATGIDVTGTATMDGLTVNSGASSTTVNFGNSGTPYATWYNDTNGVSILSADAGNTGGASRLQFNVGGVQALRIPEGGDIAFYEDTGTTPKFYWDASAESLGIGTSSPDSKIHLNDGALHIQQTDGSDTWFSLGANNDNYITTGASGITVFRAVGTERTSFQIGAIYA
jgi:hypothetical protein